MSDVTIQHEEYKEHYDNWELVEDVCDGQSEIKKKGKKYLPAPDPTDLSIEAEQRYQTYLKRAVFYGITKRMVNGLIGVAFEKEPKLDNPSFLDFIKEDIDGNGLSIYQQSQAASSEILKKGRCALLVDYPSVDSNTVSLADVEQGYIRPVVLMLQAEDVTYWETTRVGTKQLLSLVIIKEIVIEKGDGFNRDKIEQFRVLRLQDVGYTFEIWRSSDGKEWFLYQEPQIVLDGKGQAFKEIPLIFVGSINNAPDVDPAPCLDIAHINIAHYQNSADYEQLTFKCGQVQPVITGLTEEWHSLLKKEKIVLGAGALLPLPHESDFKYVQAEEKTIVKEAMKEKEALMQALGAGLLEKGSAVKTATQVTSESRAEYSVLSLAISNINEAYNKCMQWMMMFLNISGDALYEINTQYNKTIADAQMLQALNALYQGGKFSEVDYWAALRKFELIPADKTDEEIKSELENSLGGLSNG